MLVSDQQRSIKQRVPEAKNQVQTYVGGIAHEDGIGVHENRLADLVGSRRDIDHLIMPV